MKFTSSVAFIGCIGVFSFLQAAEGSDLNSKLGADPGPVKKVVLLLKDLKAKLEADEKLEQKTFDKYACWCEKTTSKKADTIEAAQNTLRALGQAVLTHKASIAELETLIAKDDKEMAANKEDQAEETKIRERANAAFQAETSEMKEALAALQKAIVVLRDGTTFLQQSDSATASATGALRAVLQTLPSNAPLKRSDVVLLNDFVSGKAKAKYAPQSMTIQGILTDMYRTFASDLEISMQTEASENRAFEDYIATKTSELLLLQEQREKKLGKKAEQEALFASTSQSFSDTDAQMKADVEFFDATKESCKTKHDEWDLRGKMRAEEIAGVNEALDILSRDSSRELFSRAIKAGKETGMVESYDTGRNIAASFVQVVTSTMESPTELAYRAIQARAAESHSLRLAMLAVQVRQAKKGHFDSVISAIDSMIKTLKDEDAADIAKRDQCIEQYKEIDSKVGEVSWLIKKNIAKLDKLESLVEARTADKIKTEEDIETVKGQIQAMDAQRVDEHNDFQQARADDQAAIDLLMEARTALTSYYSNHSIALGPIQGAVKGLALVSQPEFEVSEDEAPDAIFSGHGARKHEAKGIVQILTMIIEDLNDEIKNGLKIEEKALLEYEKLLKAATTLKSDLETKKDNLEVTIADLGSQIADEKISKSDNEGDLKDENDYKAAIKTDCDWIIGAFTKRATARVAELNGLTKAKDFLVGYDKTALLEKTNSAFDDTTFAQIRFLGLGS